MSMICTQCGKTIEEEQAAFCPFCGTKIIPAGTRKAQADPEAEGWIRKALAETAYPARKKILLQGLAACPDSREIRWELLFIGEETTEKRRRAMYFSIIRNWVLEIYRKPEIFSEKERDAMRAKLFDAPELEETFALFEDPEEKQREYLLRLCKEFIEIFLEGDSEVMGSWFGFRLERNREKKLAAPVALMIKRVRKDEKLSPEQREQLWQTLYRAYSERVDGKTEYLEAQL